MSRDYWENRYQTHDMPWEKGEASPGLVDFLAAQPGLPRGTVGIPGRGKSFASGFHRTSTWCRTGCRARIPTGPDWSECSGGGGIRQKRAAEPGELRVKKHVEKWPVHPYSEGVMLEDRDYMRQSSRS